MYVSEILLKVLMWDNMLKVYTKEEAIVVLKDIMEKHNVDRLLVVHGQHSYMVCGGNELMSRLYDVHNMEIANFADFSTDPKIEDVYKGADLVKQYRPDAITAIGGGSTMDMAKLLRHTAGMKETPLIAIPTTSGTGSETTQFAVCFINGEKKSIDFSHMLPNYEILIPELTMSNSRYLTACTGFDAMAQAVESYWNIHATEKSEDYAKEALILLVRCLAQFATDPELCMADQYWRTDMMKGANLAGKAINITRTTAPHAMSYKLTSEYGYPHGHAVALTFPYFAQINIECTSFQYVGHDYMHYREKMRWLKLCFGITHQDIELYFQTFANKIGLGLRKDTNVDTELIASSVNVERAANNPHVLTQEILVQAAESIIRQ